MKKQILLSTMLLIIIMLVSCRKKNDPKTNIKDDSKTTTVTDKDGNVYNTVTIGTQTWMSENLKTSRYNDGTAIPLVTDALAWETISTPGYCWYNNDAATYKNKYGALYNVYVVKTGKLAPTGWHIPTDAEWTTLDKYLTLNGYNYDGSTWENKYVKSLAATTGWMFDKYEGTVGNDLLKNNRTGFSALPGGYRCRSVFSQEGTEGNWWSSSSYRGNTWYREMSYNDRLFERNYTCDASGFSVRCVRDN